MAGSLTDTAEAIVLNALNTNTATGITLPLLCALITTATPSTDASAGSEVVAGGNAYARQSVTMGSASGTSPASSSNTNTLTWSNMPAVTVGGVEIYDSSGTPKRLWYSTLAANKTTAAGDTFQIAIGQLSITCD